MFIREKETQNGICRSITARAAEHRIPTWNERERLFNTRLGAAKIDLQEQRVSCRTGFVSAFLALRPFTALVFVFFFLWKMGEGDYELLYTGPGIC